MLAITLLCCICIVCQAFQFSLKQSKLLTKSLIKSHHNDLAITMSTSESKPKKVIVLGGDGFCGWPTSLYLSDKGHDVIILDNLSRRKIDIELGCDSLTPIANIEERCKIWRKLGGGNNLSFKYLDLHTDFAELVQFLIQEKPDTVVHFAEQRAAPYSMKDARRKRYTIDNNVSGTHNLLAAIVESGLDIHVVHLGSKFRLLYLTC